MMVMPLGPDFAKALSIDLSSLGIISGSYTAASALTGILSAPYLERFDRKIAILVTLSGLVASTMIAGLSQNLTMLLGARIVAGIFGGPSTSLALAIISDVVPPERRGRALGAVMSSFAIASIVGVPLGLEAARLGGWRIPFFLISLLGVLIILGVALRLPNFKSHLKLEKGNQASLMSMVARPSVIYSLITSGLLMSSGFMLIPSIAPYVQANLNYPRENMGILYFFGGLASFASMIFFGRLTDRLGALVVGSLGCAAFITSVFFGFVMPFPTVPVVAFFSLFMVASALRGVAFNTLSSKIPEPYERARFMSIQSSVQHLSSALGAGISSLVLSTGENQKLIGMELLGLWSIGLNFLMIFGLWLMQKSLKNQKISTV